MRYAEVDLVGRGRRRGHAAGADRGDQAPDHGRASRSVSPARRESSRLRTAGVRAHANRGGERLGRESRQHRAAFDGALGAAEDRGLVVRDGLGELADALWDFDKHYQYIGRAGGEGVGYHAPASVGAALANKKHGRISVSIQPDGDLMVAPGALWTAARHQIPILIVMQNNRAYHQEVMWFQREALLRGRSVELTQTGFGLGDPNIDFAKMAASMGVAVVGADHGSEGSRPPRSSAASAW